MSSTTDRSRGQALAVFAIGFTSVVIAAALAFDAGAMIVERRDQQNGADAAALAGARYVQTDIAKALSTARAVATANGFTHGVDSQSVTISVPATSGAYQGLSGYIEVQIASTRPSVFAGILGVTGWQVAARAVATNGDGMGGFFSILSVDPSECDAMLVTGSGNLLTYGNIHVNSDCSGNALRRQGGGDISVDVDGGACDVVGGISDGGGQGIIDCVQNEGAPELPDPLAQLPDPAMPSLAPAVVQLVGSDPIPAGCPGSASPATLAAPDLCVFNSSYAGSSWRLFPGLYPGGLEFAGGTFYLEPGVYYLAGGGLDIGGNGAEVMSVDAGGTTGPAGGVMFYNTEIPGSAIGPIYLNGSSADIDLLPLDEGTRYDGLVIFQDRAYDINGDDVTINGSDSDMNVRGTIYVPGGDLKVNGGGGELTMDQIIAGTFVVHGAPGSQIKVLNEEQFRVQVLAAGLIE